MEKKTIKIVNQKNFQIQSPYSKPRETLSVNVGGINIGSSHPIVIQAMTNTDTADVNATVNQITKLSDAGAQMVRVTINNKQSASAIPKIYERLAKKNISTPIIGDFHYIGDKLLQEFPETAKLLAKYRINPGNAGKGNKKNKAFSSIINTALKYNKPIRIGVNWGSLDSEVLQELMDKNAKLSNSKPDWAVMRQALVNSAISSAKLAQKLGLPANKIILSCKVSNVSDLIAINRELAKKTSYPIHLGLTEAGLGDKGIISSTLGIGILLSEGIGNTIRVSLTPMPNDSRTREVKIAQEILQSLGLRNFFPSVIACPGCGRTTSTYFQELASNIQNHIQLQIPKWQKQNPDFANLKIAVMGCIVNGPGESKHADLGISLPGTGENPAAPIYIDGEHKYTLRGDNISKQFIEIIDNYVKGKK